jgi:hypothetical protein
VIIWATVELKKCHCFGSQWIEGMLAPTNLS